MKTRFSFLFAALALLCATASAGEWIGPYPVRYVEVYNGSVFLMLKHDGSQSYSSPLYSGGCNNTTIFFQSAAIVNPKDLDRIFASATAAQATGAKVKVFVTGCNTYLVATAIASDPTW